MFSSKCKPNPLLPDSSQKASSHSSVALNIPAKSFSRKNEMFNPKKESSFIKFGNAIINMMNYQSAYDKEIFVVCIGTDRATGDSLGPLVGDMVKRHCPDFKVVGTLKNPVHALNLKETIHRIYVTYPDAFVIAVDASLGKSEDIGMVTLSDNPIFPGKGVNKKLPAIGDISITGIVNQSGHGSASLLQSTRLYDVVVMSECIGNALIYAHRYINS